MAINKEHASIILERVFECQDPAEQIALISGKDKQRFPIHRVILNAASKFFTGLMGPKFQENKPKEFILKDADGRTIKNTVDFCYTGIIELTEDNVETCLAIASSVEIDLLVDKCRQFYSSKLSVANAVDILMVADNNRFVELRQRALDFISENFDVVATLDILKLGHPLLQELLKYDKIHESGDLCAQRLVAWFQAHESERAVYMPELLKLIRLEQLTLEYLSDTLEAVFKKFKLSDFVNAEYKRRATSHRVNVDIPRSRSFFSVFLQNGTLLKSDCTKIKIEKYNSTSRCFEESAEISLGQRFSAGLVVHKNKLFVLGGVAPEKPMKSMFSYDLSTRERKSMPEMNVARRNFTCLVVNKFIYVFGGYGDGKILDTCERFDTENNTWKILKSMKVARYSASATVLNGYIYIAGGHTDWDDLEETNTVELYDPNIDEWTKKPPMNKTRVGFALNEWNGFLYAIGDDDTIEKYNPHTNCWTEIGSFEGSRKITSSINIEGKLFGMMRTGEFGLIEIDQGGKQSFALLSKSKYGSNFLRRHFMYHA